MTKVFSFIAINALQTCPFPIPVQQKNRARISNFPRNAKANAAAVKTICPRRSKIRLRRRKRHMQIENQANCETKKLDVSHARTLHARIPARSDCNLKKRPPPHSGRPPCPRLKSTAMPPFKKICSSSNSGATLGAKIKTAPLQPKNGAHGLPFQRSFRLKLHPEIPRHFPKS